MRRAARMLIALAAALITAAPATAQTTKYWPQLEIAFPVPAAVLDLSPRPTKLRLYAAAANGRFERVKELAVDRLDDIPGRRPGFKYSARGDGEEEFAVQQVFADGTVSPAERDLKPEFKVVFDTRPPAVTLEALGAYGAQWKAVDENLENGVKLECRWVGGETRWHEVTSRKFSAKDDYTWPALKSDGRTLEVRVIAKDKAGHEGVSRIIRLPDTGGNPRRELNSGTPTGDLRDPVRPGDDSVAQSQIVYVNRREMTIRSKLTHVTRSGVSKVHLYVKEMGMNAVGEWKFDRSKDCNIAFDAADTTIEIPYVAAKDGRYGFIVIPESGVGRREPEPRTGAPPQHLVEVDTLKPVVKIRTVTVTNGTVGPRVEIEWDADDRNLMPDPIVLEYAADKSAGNWLSIAEKIPNSRRYVWEVADKTMFKVFIRARATDKATNVGEHIYDQAVVIDLDKPSATIEAIRGSGSALQLPNPSSQSAPAPPLSPLPLTPEKPPLVAPTASGPMALPTIPGGSVPAPEMLPQGK